jgi:hypothetical protein
LADFPSSFYFAHFFSSELCSHCLQKTNAASGWLFKYLSDNYCDFLTPTDAVTQKYLAAEKYYYPNRLGWHQKVLQPLKTFMLLS